MTAQVIRWPDARPTRYRELGYMKLAPRVWRIVDLEETRRAPNNTPCVTGPAYLTKAELLADLDRFARDYGATAL